VTAWFHGGGLALALPLVAACGGAPDVLSVSFLDELVEAPARGVSVAVVEGADCATLLTQPHDGLEAVGTVLVRRALGYPVPPDAAPFEGLPRGRALAVDVAVEDADRLQIARSCVEVTLTPDAATTVALVMHGLPPCADPPVGLDLALLMDTSTGMRDANIALEGALTDRVKAFVESMGVTGGVRFSVITHGHTDPQELLPPSEDKQAVLTALESLRDVAAGPALHYEGISRAVGLLRARAVCGRRPALLWLGGGADESAPGAFEISTIEVVGTRGEPADDVYVYAVGLSAEAVAAMRLLVDAVSDADFEGALTQVRLAEALNNAHFRFQSLVEP
jgi:hypothetical protein